MHDFEHQALPKTTGLVIFLRDGMTPTTATELVFKCLTAAVSRSPALHGGVGYVENRSCSSRWGKLIGMLLQLRMRSANVNAF